MVTSIEGLMFNISFWHKGLFIFWEPGEDLELGKWSVNPLTISEVSAMERESSLLHPLDFLGPEILLSFDVLSVELHLGFLC
jgi:hypothetical protein